MHDTRDQLFSIHRLVWIALMAALTAAGALVSIPVAFISPVPISLQTMFVLLSGLILGPRGGALAVLLYIAAGCLGLPVFAGGKSGLASFLGPTGGFLAGFLPAAVCCGFAKRVPVRPYPALVLYCAVATAITLVIGTAHMAITLNISVHTALAGGVFLFLPGEILKCFGAAFIYRFLAVRRLVPA